MTNTTNHPTPGLDALQEAMARGDITALRRAVVSLDAREQAALEARLGREAVQGLMRRVRRAVRGPRLGRVVVIHGIMGAQLDAVGPSGDVDRVWVHLLRLALGRIEDLRLLVSGAPADPQVQIRTAGLFPDYLPLVLELAEQWDVLPFAYDWRKDIDDSADQLADQVRRWAGKEPFHMVAHSMGGLVARRLAQRSAPLWSTMADGTALRRGGRLVMLGTPNKGSFAATLVLTGEEKTVRRLAAVDQAHTLADLRQIIGTFPGAYQLLPSPLESSVDDRSRLYQPESWGSLPIVAQHLAKARSFHEELSTVVDPERLIYVAGYDQPTPHRIRISQAGEFEYQLTQDGDGRVPHELGLLDRVQTFWVDEVHGDLPRNRSVLAAIHDLLERGITGALLPGRPSRRGAVELAWRRPGEVEQLPPDEPAMPARPAVRRGQAGTAVEEPAPEHSAQIEARLLQSFLGGAGAPTAGRSTRRGVKARSKADDTTPRSRPHQLKVAVRWGDVTKFDADVYAVGHYQGVLPQNAEAALDQAMSRPDATDEDLLLTQLTRRGLLRGALGEITTVPWTIGDRKGRAVAVAGMGHPGSFDAPELRHLARNLAMTILAFPDLQRACTVLIGGGAGNLSVPVATECLLRGFAEALDVASSSATLSELTLIELQLDRAYEIHDTLQRLRGRKVLEGRLEIDSAPLAHAENLGGALGPSFCLGLTVASAAAAAAANGDARSRQALDTLLAATSSLPGSVDQVLAALQKLDVGTGMDLVKAGAAIKVTSGSADTKAASIPTRLTYVRQDDAIVAAALTDTAVKPERRLSAEPSLLDQHVQRMIDPDPELVPELGADLANFVVPLDFRELVSRGRPTVFEVDRRLASVHWEMLPGGLEGVEGESKPLSLIAPVARQLRTGYSPPPTAAPPPRWPLRALVIGDPGSERAHESLLGAREEALAVDALLRSKGLEVETFIGAESTPRAGPLASVEPASLRTVLTRLMRGGYDLLHYAGHGSFDPSDGTASGWLFEGGLLRSQELAQVALAPRLVVANACLSGRTSNAFSADPSRRPALNEADLLPSLADEFFRRGVRDYIGTAWEVNDVGAVVFATKFYEALFPSSSQSVTIGDALLAARTELKAEERRFGALWAAYQHYGDPFQVVRPRAARPATGPGQAAGRGP